MEREVGGGIGMGNTCKSMAVSFQFMTKSTTIKKKNGFTSSGKKFVVASLFQPVIDSGYFYGRNVI